MSKYSINKESKKLRCILRSSNTFFSSFCKCLPWFEVNRDSLLKGILFTLAQSFDVLCNELWHGTPCDTSSITWSACSDLQDPVTSHERCRCCCLPWVTDWSWIILSVPETLVTVAYSSQKHRNWTVITNLNYQTKTVQDNYVQKSLNFPIIRREYDI